MDGVVPDLDFGLFLLILHDELVLGFLLFQQQGHSVADLPVESLNFLLDISELVLRNLKISFGPE